MITREEKQNIIELAKNFAWAQADMSRTERVDEDFDNVHDELISCENALNQYLEGLVA